MTRWASSRRVMLRMLLRSRADQVSAPLVSLRKLSAASAGIAAEDAVEAVAFGGETVGRRGRGVMMEFPEACKYHEESDRAKSHVGAEFIAQSARCREILRAKTARRGSGPLCAGRQFVKKRTDEESACFARNDRRWTVALSGGDKSIQNAKASVAFVEQSEPQARCKLVGGGR